MDATTKYKNKNNSIKQKKLVKRNWKKITAIVAIVVILLTGLGVGLYFALRTTLPKVNGITYLSEWKEMDDILNKNDGTDKKTGLIFTSNSDSVSNYLMYGKETDDPKKDSDIKKDKKAQGVFAKYLREQTSMDWYAFNAKTQEETKKQINDFLVSDTDEYGSSKYTGANYIGELNNSGWIEYNNSKTEVNITIDANPNYDSKDKNSNKFIANTDDITPPEEGGDSVFSSPLLMWFNGSHLEFFSIGSVSNSDDDTKTEPTVKSFNDIFNNFEKLASKLD